jgi:hypothetical protein
LKIDFSAILLDLRKQPLVQSSENKVPVTLAWVTSEALLRPTEDKDGVKKYKLYALATKIMDGGVVELLVEDVALIKQHIGEHFAPLVVGRAYDLLESPASNSTP